MLYIWVTKETDNGIQFAFKGSDTLAKTAFDLDLVSRNWRKLKMESPDVFWLNVTNAALGVGFLVCLGMIVVGIVQDFAQRFHHHGPRSH